MHFPPDVDGINDLKLIYPACIGTNEARTIAIFNEYYNGKYPFNEIRQNALNSLRNKITRNGPPLMPGAAEIISGLYRQDYQLALASSTASDLVKHELDIAGLKQFFTVIVGGDMVRRGKPSPDIFLTACDRLGCEPSETYVIEDSENGIKAAYAAGTIPIMVPDLIIPSEEVTSMCAYILDNISEIRDILL